MALAQVQYESNGSITTYSIPFPYLSREDITVNVDGLTTRNFTFLDESTISLDSAPSSGSIIDIRRETEKRELLVGFNDGSTLLESDLNTANLQSLYLVQEVIDQSGSLLFPTGGGNSYTLDTVADMEDNDWLVVGHKVRTLGYNTPGDGGGNNYEIVSPGTGTVDGGKFIGVKGGNQAKAFFSYYVCPEHFGAVGDGVADDLSAVSSAITTAWEKKLPFSMAQKDYYCPGQLPVYSGTQWIGSGMPYQRTRNLNLFSIEPDGGEAIITVEDPEGDVSYRLMEGDPVKIAGCNDSANNGMFSVRAVDPENNQVTILNRNAVTDNSPDGDAYLRVSTVVGGTILRMTNLEDGSVHTGDRFIDERGVRNLVWRDFGFIGPGINSIYGGGLRFRRTPDNRAITGYEFRNIRLEHTAMDGLRFDQLIHSNLAHLRISRCVGDGLVFRGEHGIGGTTTSVHIDSPYIQNCRRGIASFISAYATVTNPVIEGSAVGYFFERAIGLTFNSLGAETIKFDKSGQSNGTTGVFSDCYGLTFNSPVTYYNTEEDQWSKAAFVFLDPKNRVESPLGVINGGHIHWSVGTKVKILATRWDAGSDTGRLYVDVSDDWGYVPPADDGSMSSSWIGNSYWDDSVQIKIGEVQRDSIFNERYKVTSISKASYYTGYDHEDTRDPGPNDDSDAGFSAFDPAGNGTWKNTNKPGDQGRFFCIDATPGNARWADANSLYEIEFNGRKYNPLGKEAEPESSDAYAIRAGRNYGCDIATDNIQRVITTETGGTGEFITEMDVTHCFPARYIVELNYDPYFQVGSRQYVVKDQVKESVNGTDYVRVALVISDKNGVTHDNVISDAVNGEGEPIEMTFEDMGVPYLIPVDKIKQDASSGHLYVYMSVDKFFAEGDRIDIYNTRLSQMEGEWVVDTARIIESDELEGLPAVEVTFKDGSLGYNIAKTVDDAVYVSLDRWSVPVSTQLTVNGFDTLFTYDRAEAISQTESRQGKVTFDSGEAEKTINLPAVDNFEFSAKFPGSFTQARVKSSGWNTVTFERDATTEKETLKWSAHRKKSPGFEAIKDRNSGSGTTQTGLIQ